MTWGWVINNNFHFWVKLHKHHIHKRNNSPLCGVCVFSLQQSIVDGHQSIVYCFSILSNLFLFHLLHFFSNYNATEAWLSEVKHIWNLRVAFPHREEAAWRGCLTQHSHTVWTLSQIHLYPGTLPWDIPWSIGVYKWPNFSQNTPQHVHMTLSVKIFQILSWRLAEPQ